MSTDFVMMAIGIAEQDLSVMLDPRSAEKIRAMELAAPMETFSAVRRSVRVFLNNLIFLEIQRRGVDLGEP